LSAETAHDPRVLNGIQSLTQLGRWWYMSAVDSTMSSHIVAANVSLNVGSSLGPLSLVDRVEYAMRNERKSARQNGRCSLDGLPVVGITFGLFAFGTTVSSPIRFGRGVVERSKRYRPRNTSRNTQASTNVADYCYERNVPRYPTSCRRRFCLVRETP
jgi:hypothetical protein